ncbi:MAG: aminodeoxychorismate synthase component I [Gammaproteobacteria bacterium]|nr:MAG: aminodeoxychorismate synthase component I [Gammaproteobacteria bacterium]
MAVFPDLADLHAANPARYPHLLESVAHGTPQARYDILFAFPGETLTADTAGDFLDDFERRWRECVSEPTAPADTPPFTGGWFVFLSYELGTEIEPALGAPPRDATLPVAMATRFPAAIIRDHQIGATLLVCETERAAELMPRLCADIEALRVAPSRGCDVTDVVEDDPQDFLDGVERVLEYIRAGDVFQVNLSREWRARLAAPSAPVELYRRLRHANPAPFAALMTLPGNRAVISSSPERLVRVEDNIVRTRPIAGTHPRSADAAEDRRLSQALLVHPKERAEHVMLIDLERNDLGRVCRPGTVRVPEFMVLESYRHVHHIVSEVRGELRDGITPAQVIRAVFPGGTITGCPKVRCMQIVAELERVPRGAYTGALGYINRDGGMDLNILIRTLVQDGTSIRLRAGAGIVADSVPARELEETRAKAKGLLAALTT